MPNVTNPAVGGRERYFREIAARFFALRGAPFSLSPADVHLISSWESAGIPLAVVLEGIENSFSLRPGKAHVPGKIRTISFCRMSVEQAFARYRDRATGGTRPSGKAREAEKRAAARAAGAEFLVRGPAELAALFPFFEKALVLLAADRPAAESLERLEAEIEAALRSLAGAEDRRAAEDAVGREHPDLRGRAKTASVDVVLVRRAREKFRIPHVSLFYY